MSIRVSVLLITSVLVGVLVFAPSSSNAAISSFNTPTGATLGGQPVDAAVTFSTAAGGAIHITLQDLLQNPTDVGQLLSDLSFHIAGATGTLTGSLTGSSGQEVTVAGNGSFTTGGSPATGWAFTGGTGGNFLLNVLGTPIGPAHLIIGPPNTGTGTFSAANGSIAGNGPHNPFIFEVASFDVSVTGVTAATLIDNVVFSFGTTPGANVPAAGSPVPEPGTLLLLGVGLAGVAGAARWGRRRS
jgi:hypothetical protein